MPALTVHLDRPDLLDDLVASLRNSGCWVVRLGRRSCAVRHDAAVDEHEARVEVMFFVRAWQRRHGFVRASVSP